MLRALALLACLLPAAVLAQGQSVRQSGTVSPGHVACWTVSGIVQDCGIAAVPFANVFGLVGTGTGTPFFIDTNTPAGPFNQFTLGFNPTDFILSLTALGGATHIPMQFCVNGFCSLALGDGNITLSEVLTTGTVPVVTAGAGACGTSPAIVGNDNVGRVTVGSSTNAGLCPVTFSQAFPHTPVCVSQNATLPGRIAYAASVTTTGFVLTANTSFTAADVLMYICLGYN